MVVDTGKVTGRAMTEKAQGSIFADKIKNFDEVQLMDWFESKEIPREFCLEFESKYYWLSLTKYWQFMLVCTF